MIALKERPQVLRKMAQCISAEKLGQEFSFVAGMVIRHLSSTMSEQTMHSVIKSFQGLAELFVMANVDKIIIYHLDRRSIASRRIDSDQLSTEAPDGNDRSGVGSVWRIVPEQLEMHF
jgi:hypothetical protein